MASRCTMFVSDLVRERDKSGLSLEKFHKASLTRIILGDLYNLLPTTTIMQFSTDNLSRRNWKQATSETASWVVLSMWHAEQLSTFTLTSKSHLCDWRGSLLLVLHMCRCRYKNYLLWQDISHNGWWWEQNWRVPTKWLALQQMKAKVQAVPIPADDYWTIQ